ncbi:hypothetical protein QE152_g12699 [Popillia japonica]|uniref:Schlafen AlbA-2 domain-containing protein n=1 Tax=Popillia japonica TaxID=7064 RepID=A0AAW1LR30_POPJA
MVTSLAKLPEDFNSSLDALKVINDSQQTQTRAFPEFESIVHEVVERQSRKNNLIIFGVAEQPSNITSAQRNQNEHIDVDTILNAAISTSQPSNYKLHRLGRFNPSNTRPRPIKLVLGNESEVHEIIRHAKNLKNHGTYNTIRLSYDRTPRELQRFKDLKRFFFGLIASLRNEMVTSLAKLREDFNSSLDALKVINDSQQTQTRAFPEFESIVHEVVERQSRKNNLIIFGVAEQPSNITSAQRNQNEHIDVDTILNAAISTSQPSNYKLHRLGRFNPSNTRPRPIKLVLGNESEVHEIIRHAKNLKNHGTYNTIRLSYDRTPRL